MSAWNYRVVKRRLPPPENHDWYAIHEAHFDDNGNLTSITERPVATESDSMQGLRQVRSLMFQALRAPVIDYDDLPWVRKKRKSRAPTDRRGLRR